MGTIVMDITVGWVKWNLDLFIQVRVEAGQHPRNQAGLPSFREEATDHTITFEMSRKVSWTHFNHRELDTSTERNDKKEMQKKGVASD